jgi:hypothetical protein
MVMMMCGDFGISKVRHGGRFGWLAGWIGDGDLGIWMGLVACGDVERSGVNGHEGVYCM